jgi:S-formylglutathione hydrolase FrmB
MADISVIDGPVPVVVLIVGAIALVILLARRGRAALVTVAIAVAVALVTLLGLNWLLTRGLNLFPETLPTVVTLWISLGAAAVVLVVGNLVGTAIGRKVLAVASGLAVLLAAGSQINVYFAEYPTLGALAGADGDISPLTGSVRRPSASAATPVVDRWTGPATGKSQVLTTPIPGTASGFAARDAYVYLPAAYSSPSPPLLPVVVLVSGQPGGPQDWIVSGQLQTQLDQFAAANGGLAPVTVVVDPNGPKDTITMCMDSDIARADTYLSQDVPSWITSELGVDANHAHWAFGGFSYGGTCAIQMATRHTQLYPSFIDISGEREPAISADRTQTIQAAFGGDAAGFDALTPLTLLSQHRYPDVWGFFAVGADDGEFLPAMTEVSAAAQKAGMTVHTQTVPGQGHSWAVPEAVILPALEWLGPRLGLTRASS